MSKTFGIRINNVFVPVAREEKGQLIVTNPILLVVKGQTPIECTDDTNYTTVHDLHVKLGEQTLSKPNPTHVLREDVISNELEK